jgi:hypothetical protein
LGENMNLNLRKCLKIKTQDLQTDMHVF